MKAKNQHKAPHVAGRGRGTTIARAPVKEEQGEGGGKTEHEEMKSRAHPKKTTFATPAKQTVERRDRGAELERGKPQWPKIKERRNRGGTVGLRQSRPEETC